MLSTLHANTIIDFLKLQSPTRFSELWDVFVVTKRMNQTTLYRIIERFKKEHIIHEIDSGDDRFFCLCEKKESCHSGIEIQLCTNCESSYEKHFPLPEDILHAEKIAYLKKCISCK